MARIDVSELMTDDDFTDTITVIRTAQVVGNNGRSADTVTTFPDIIAIVQPASGQQQKLLPEGTRAEGSIAVYSKFRFKQIEDGYAGDQITWDGSLYTAQSVNSYSNWGAGWMQAICTLKSLVS